MKRRDALVLAGTALFLAGCWGNTYTYKQKLTVVVQTPDGEASGSAVTEVRANVGDQGVLSEAIVNYRVRGEATVVDLGHGKYLFALLSSGGERTATEYWAMDAFYKRVMPDYPSGSIDRLNTFYAALLSLRDRASMARDQYPLLVTFSDINVPASVKEVKPGDLPAAFGDGYRLKSITLEITDEDVTRDNIQRVLPWSHELIGSIGKNMKLPYEHILNQVNDGSFARK